ncbi:MAG TPA: DUF6421 family protein, partial [Arthrobacter sp.]
MTETLTAAVTGISANNQDWLRLKAAATALQALQVQDGSIADTAAHSEASAQTKVIIDAVSALSPAFPHDSAYLEAVCTDFSAWADGGFGVPDFLSSLLAFQPQEQRRDGLQHLVVFPMYTQNGSSSRLVEAVLIEVIWPEFIAGLEGG